MFHDGGKKTKLDGLLDKFASRIGIVAVVGLLFAVCIGSGLHVRKVVKQIGQNHKTFQERDARNGYVAMSDIQRLLLVAQKAVHHNKMTAELEKEYRAAADTLYVRMVAFKAALKNHEHIETGDASIKAIEEIMRIADTAIEQGFPDIRQLVGDLLDAAVIARSRLVQFLDVMRRKGDRILESQNDALHRQQFMVLGNLASLTLVGCVSLLLLRREVLVRHGREQAEKRVEFLAFFDNLTELPNRSQFQDRLLTLLDQSTPVALLYVDLDDFKSINDTYGHAAGDAVLCHISRILADQAEALGGFAARLGGDEFALVITTEDLDELTTLCQGIMELSNTPFSFEGESLEIGLSIGLATSTQVAGRGPATLDMLSRVTDFALYASKEAGRKRYTLYDEELEKRFLERRAMLEELPQAIADGLLEVHLQPKVHLRDGTVFGFEALVRWRRDGQLVPPDSFIMIAEESGLVVDIDHFVLRHATQLVADWNSRHGTEFSVSVNLSALHFNTLRIVEWVQDALWSSMLPPGLLVLEITETMEMRDWTQAGTVISRLREAGSKIAIDDFGTGYSSLAYLRTTSADELKIDRSLIHELESSQKVRLMLASVLDIAQNLDLSVTVEGIETQTQAHILQKMGAECGQGYFYGKPLPPQEALTAAMDTIYPEGMSRVC